MKLGELFAALEGDAVLPPGLRDREVANITYDSRTVREGSLFVAVRGFRTDGHQFIPQAWANGAVAVIAEKGRKAPAGGAPLIMVDDTRRALALLSDLFYDHPSRKLALIGITGTNGKTTTSYLVKSIIEASGRTAGLIGTIDYRVGDRVYPAPNTTPESLDLQRLLAEMADHGADYCVAEVSSHALALGRTLGCSFAVGAFTNLTQDHLDFHETMDAYFGVKLRLFSGLSSDAHAVINGDDERAAEIIGATQARIVTTGLSGQADIRPHGAIAHGIGGLSFAVTTPSGPVGVESRLVGRHNIANILTAVGIGVALGLDNEAIAAGIRNMRAVPGRLEAVDAGQPYAVVVDYAHTEDAVVRLLEAVREVASNRIITVFGCGGDRDRTKRPRMGAAAARGSEVVILTSDNPRTENPLDIIGEIENGMAEAGAVRAAGPEAPAPSGMKTYYVMPDRHAAVAAAVQMAMPGDVVVLAGKGHEAYQIIGEDKLPFSDRDAAREAIRKRSSGERREHTRSQSGPHSGKSHG